MIELSAQQLRAAIFAVCTDLVPPIIRNELLSDPKLRRDLGIRTDAVVTLGGSKVGFKRSKLFAAACAAASAPGSAQKLADETGAAWEVVAGTAKGSSDLVIRSGGQTFHAGHLLLLTQNKKARKGFYARQAEELNLGSETTKRLRHVLEKRPLSEEELSELMLAIGQTPLVVTGRIMEHLARGSISLKELVPRSLGYYERLIGRLAAQTNIEEYVKEVAGEHIRKLLAWRLTDGLHYALLMGSHSLIALEIARSKIPVAEFNKLANWARESDALARGVTLELALQRSRDKAKIAASAQLLAERFIGRGPKEQYNPFLLLSAAFVMVYGELAKVRTLASAPPFWRRLAALSHAALVTRCVLSTSGDLSKLVAWMGSVRLRQYQVQCIVDQRTEPRWLPDFGLPEQIRNEIGGRVLAAAARNETAANKLGIRDALIGDIPDSLKKQLDLLFIQLPGPLEGNVESHAQLAADVIEEMRKDLAASSPSVSSFGRVANAALFCTLPDDIPRLAADAIRRAQYRLDSNGDRDALRSCLAALATVAAISKSQQLADELFVVIRSYRRLYAADLDINAAFRIGLTACASRTDLSDWCKCVGTLIADLGFGELSHEEATTLHPLISDLCDIVPELWATCGPGIAAVESVVFA